MASVKSRINVIKQPKEGYIPLSFFRTVKHKNKEALNLKENIAPNIVGLTVDYLTRFILNHDVKKSFEISLKGAEIAQEYFNKYNAKIIANDLATQIKGLDDRSIIAAVELVNYDVYYRNGLRAKEASSKIKIPDVDTIENIRIMTERCVNCLKYYSNYIKDGFSFEPDGYSDCVDRGDGDYISKDTIWDIKVSKYVPSEKDTLQLGMYYVMGKHSNNGLFNDITRLAIYNPRLNTAFFMDTKDISNDVICEIEDNIIEYSKELQEELDI